MKLSTSQLLAIGVCLFLSSTASAKKRFKDPEKCGRPSCKVPVKFGYKERTDYVYKYSASVSTKFDGASEDSAETSVSFLVHLQFRTRCEGIIKLTDVGVFSGTSGEMTPVENENLHLLEAHALRFFYDDGNIAEICPEADEPVWVLNMKRSVLSAIQNTMDRFDMDQYLIERDINGDCVVGYFFKEVDGTTLVIDKKLDISSCVNRYQIYSIIPMTPYIFQRKYHKWTPMNSTVFCHQHIDHKVLTQASCEEHHQYQPFYNQSNGAKSKGKIKLTLLSESPLPAAEIETLKRIGEVHDRQILLFDHNRPTKASDHNLNECKELLKSLCDINMVEFKPKYTEYFNRFIHVGRDLSVPALRQLYSEASGLCPTGHTHMMDALPYIRSRAAAEIMTDIINERTLDNSTISEWLLIMTFYPRPDGEIVEAVLKLVPGRAEEVGPQTLLTLTTIIHNFCERSPDCGNHPAVLGAVRRIEAAVQDSCTTPSRKHAYSGLKALGNAGVITPTLNSTLQKCIENEDLPLDMRIEAINCHRRLPCETNRIHLLKLFRDKKKDVELRIAAYLQLMRCPSYAILRAIRTSLIIEEYNQVGSFVWSHLKTQMKSSFPARVEVQAMLQDEQLSNKFDKDFRKFSRNYETSFYFNRYGVGVFLETNVIFSYKSYVPRTVIFNATISIFGETLNVFEVSLYFHGLETYLDEIFNKNNLIDKKLIDSVVQLIRKIRSATTLQELINEIPYMPILDEVKISIGIKMFGNELNYFTIEGLSELKEELEKLNPMKILRNFFSGQEINFTKSSMLIDTSYVTPMMVGIPLKLNAIGTAAVKFDAQGFIKASRLKTDSELDIKGRLVPSLGVSLNCFLEADSFVANAGAKFKGTVYTSTALEGTFKMRSLRFVQVAFILPLDKSDIVHAETHLLLMTERQEVELRGATGDRPPSRNCSWSLIDETVGLKMCANTLLPDAESLLRSPFFFFSGPLQLGVTLEKSDPTAKLYILEYRVDTVNNKTVLVFSFDTPGSATKRGLKAVVDLDPQSQNLTLAYQSSLTSMQAQGYYRNTPNEMLIKFGLDINNQKHIDIQMGVEIVNGTSGHTVTLTYYPRLSFAINSKTIVDLKGNITWVRKSEISQCQINLDLATNRFETLITGYGRLTDVSVATNLRMDYKFGKGSWQTVRFEIVLGNKSTKFLASYLGQMQLESTAYPEINLILGLTYQKAQSHTDCQMNMITNPYVKDERQKLRVRWHYQLYKTYVFEKRNITLEISKPSNNVDVKFAFFKQSTAATLTSIIIIKYTKGKEVVVTLDLNIPHGSTFYFDSRLKVIIPAASEQMSCFTKVFEKALRDYDLEFVGVWFSGHNLTMRGMYQDRSDPYLASHTLKILARSQLFEDLLLTGRFINWENDMKTDVQVEYKESNYGLGLAHKTEISGVYETFGELIYDSASYTFTSHIDLIAHRTRLDLHLDTYRDLNIALHGNSNGSRVDAGLNFKWDANRDPSQKLNAILQTNSYGNLNHDGKFVIEYPGRTIKSFFTSQHQSIDYSLVSKLEWGPRTAITSRFKAIYDMDIQKLIKVDGEVETPFENWEFTSMNYQMQVGKQDIKSNGTLVWQSEQKLVLDVSAGYNFTDEENYIAFISLLNSSIPEISTMRGIIKFHQTTNKITTVFFLQSSPMNLLALDASGEVKELEEQTTYMFGVGLITPFESLRYAKSSGELNMFPRRRFKGHLSLLERLETGEKKYITTVDGSLETLKESRLNFHVGTPVDRWKHLTGRFSFSASRKHLLAEVKSPAVAIGTEIVYIYSNLSHFDLKLKAYASVTGVKNLIIVGKRDVDTVDVRLGWDKLLVGLVGRTHYRTWNDVDYSLQLFTPFEGYTRASAITKLIYSDKLDLEIYLNAGNKMVGVKIQAMKHPEDDFAVPYTAEESNQTEVVVVEPFDFEEVEVGTTYWRGVFQLDTSLYPTVHGFLQLNEMKNEYTTLSYIYFPFGQLKLTDNLDFQNLLNFKNSLQVETSCNCFETGQMDFSIQGVLSRDLSSMCEFSAIVFDNEYKGNGSTKYTYVPVSEENDSEGTYNLTAEINLPLKIMKHAYTNLHFHAVSPVYIGNLTVRVNDSSLYADGTLENDGSVFITDLGLKVNSHLIILPMCRLLLSKDFTDFEKEVKIGLAFPNQKGDMLVSYGVSLGWHYDGPKYMKYQLAISTPIPSVGTIKSSVLYSSEVAEEEYFLEMYLKYADRKEITVWNSVRRDIFNFHVISTHEAFRNISLNGILKKGGPLGEKRTLDAVLSLDREYKMYGTAIVSNKRPFIMDVKLLKTATNEQVFMISLRIQKKSNRYDINAVIFRFQKRINVLCDYVIADNVGKLLNLMLTSSYPGYEKLQIYGEFLSDDYKSTVTKIKGDIASKWITTNAQLNMNVSILENMGCLAVELINKNISLDVEAAWVNKPLEHMLLQISGSGSYLDLRKSLEALLHIWNIANEFSEMSLSADINYNSYDWWLSTNVTMLWPFWHDLEFVSHAILPHKTEDHYVTLIKLLYDKSFNHSCLVVKYSSNPKKFNFEAISEFSVETDEKTGLVLLHTGKHKIYDRLTVTSEGNEYDFRNVLQSTNLKEILVVEVIYRKPEEKHNVQVVIYYPEPEAVMKSVVEFSALNNLEGQINCSTPFKAFPSIRALIKLFSTRPFYQRFVEVLWANQSAVFNYTHASSWEKELQLTNGEILVDFPLASRHRGLLDYHYKSTELEALGYAGLSYNREHLMSGNYSRESEFTDRSKQEVIKIKVNNSYLPTGIIYIHDYGQDSPQQLYPNRDFKRVELYKLNETNGFNITGEMEVKRTESKKITTLRALHSLRKLVIDTVDDGAGLYQSQANFTLKPNIWVAGGLQYFAKDDSPGRDLQAYFAYPRRYFKLICYYKLLDDYFISEISLQPNLYKTPTTMVSTLTWNREPHKKNQNVSLVFSHPSFVKNLTLEGRYTKSEKYPGKLEVDLLYSSDINKKVSFYSYIKNISVKPIFHYEYNAHGDHPASRLRLTGFGYLKILDKMIDVQENITYKRSYQPLSFWHNAFKVDLRNKMFQIQRNSLRDLTFVEGLYTRENSTHYWSGTLINGKEVHINGNLWIDPERTLTNMLINLTKDGREQLRMHGFYRDKRHSSLNLWRQYEEVTISDVIFTTKLNHSRLLTIALLWRPEIRGDLVGSLFSVSSYITSYASETVSFWTQYFRTEIYDSAMDIWFDAKPNLQDFLDDIRDYENLEEDIQIFKTHFQEAYNANDFYMQDIYKIYMDMTEEMSFKDRMAHVPKIVNELWEVMGETGETIRKSILWLVESVKKAYNKVMEFIRGLVTGETLDMISEYLQRIAGRYDKMIRDMHISFLHFVEQLWSETLSSIQYYWSRTLKTVEPTFIQFAHYMESVFWEGSKKVFEFLYARQSELMKSSVFAKNTNLTKNLDAFYEDLTKNDFITNLKKYTHMLIELIRQQYFSVVPFGYELNEIGTEIVGEMKELYTLPFVNFTVEFSREIYSKARWIYDYFNIQERLQQFLPFMYKMIVDYSHTALENEMINHGVRTRFIFEPERGQIILEEKLPMPWHAFNETPNYKEITEYKIAATIHKLLTPANFSFWTFYYKLAPLAEPLKLLPPFGAQAIIVSNKHFVTFDGNHFELTDECTYLLNHDFLDNTFSFVLRKIDTEETLILMTKNTSISVDLQKKMVTLENDKNLHLPTQVGNTYIYAEEGLVTIEDEHGFSLHCYFKFEVCSLTLSGWYFGKVSGLLGTMDNEPRTDLYKSDGQMTSDLDEFVASWVLGHCDHSIAIPPPSNLSNVDFCYSIFHSKSSPFLSCFSVVDPAPYSEVCHERTKSRLNDPACSSAFAYVLACKELFVPLKVPSFCVTCPLPYGETLEEGDFTKMEGPSVPQSSDVVLVIEAKECNQYMRDRRMVHTFASILTREFDAAGITDNRYAVVTFGGDGVFDQPHSIVVKNQVFTNERELPNYFDKIISGNGNSDIFAALKFATKLQYRAGVSKTFILIPCSDCDLANMTVEYNVLNQAFLEQNITLHVLMNADFDFEKLRVSKMFYGLDSERAYTKSDFKVLKGDMDLRRQIKLTKSMMGYCTSLALETNGTIFTGKKMGSENLALVKKFSSVFARRIAASAHPDSCQSCECVGDQNGVDYIECVPCSIPVPAYSDFEFQENGTLSSLWPSMDTLDPDYKF